MKYLLNSYFSMNRVSILRIKEEIVSIVNEPLYNEIIFKEDIGDG